MFDIGEAYEEQKHEIAHLREIIAELKQEQAWIPVSERLPTPLVSVLISNKLSGRQAIGHIYPNGDWSIYGINPTHWKPLPAPPSD